MSTVRESTLLLSLSLWLNACAWLPPPEDTGQDQADADADTDVDTDTDTDTDGDGDSYLASVDCDDNDASVHPGASEICNGKDDDCDELVDDADEDWDTTTGVVVYPDSDGDGYGDQDAAGQPSCEVSPGTSLSADDCRPEDATIHPGAPEVCLDLIDQDCDGEDVGICGPYGTFRVDDPPEGLSMVNLDGTARYGFFGTAVSLEGDLDGDGLADPVVLTPHAVSSDYTCPDRSSLVHVFASPWAGGTEVVADLDEDDALVTIQSDEPGTWVYPTFETSVDLNGDGFADLVMSDPHLARDRSGCIDADPFRDNEEGEMLGPGGVVVFLGPLGEARELNESDADLRLTGEAVYDRLGAGMAAAPATDDDTEPWLVLGAPGRDHLAVDDGTAFLFVGALSGELQLEHAHAIITGGPGEEVGDDLDLLDLDGDGRRDLVVDSAHVGDDLEHGYTGLFMGVPTGEVALADADIIVSYSNTPADVDDWSSVGLIRSKAAGDVDGDGYEDILFRNPYYPSMFEFRGEVYLVSGADLEPGEVELEDLATEHWLGLYTEYPEHLGSKALGVGDLDQDGFDDFAISARFADEAFEGQKHYQGAVYLFYGSADGFEDAQRSAPAVIFGSEEAQLGLGLSGGGDTNGDGYPDLMLGAWKQGLEVGSWAGRAHLILGGPRPEGE